MVVLAIASLVIIPEMIAVDGREAWGSIALGQAIGATAAVVIAYGWQITGPVLVAQGDPASRRREYAESLVVRSLLFVPMAALAALTSILFANQRSDLAAMGAVSMASVGLSASWYFVGMSRPSHLFLAETLPRVLGTLMGILWMRQGAGAMTGLASQFGGILAATVVASVWILFQNPPAEAATARRPVRSIFARQVHGLGASVFSSVYLAAPIVIVSLVAPAIQPVYALVDKLQRQISVGLHPFVAVLQGWVPRARPEHRNRRNRQALAFGAGFSLTLAVLVSLAAALLVDWVGGGTIRVSALVFALMGGFVGLGMFEAVLARAVLPSLGRLGVVSRATALSALVGLPLCALGALVSVELALLGVLVGIFGRMTIELVVALRMLTRVEPESESVVEDGL